MAIANGLLIASVTHARQRPKRHAFRYTVYYLCFALDELQKLRQSLLSLNRFNLFSFHARDHGQRPGQPLEEWIRNTLSEWKVTEADGRIVLLTLPRVLGHVFNPVSFWFCLDREGRPRAVISEVNNTDGDRHCYISFRDDHGPITQDDWLRAEKIFYVSPFLHVTGHYEFRFAYGEEKLGVWINYFDAEGLMFNASLTGKRRPLNTLQLTYCFFRYPLVTLQVVGLIHYQAVRLRLKGIRPMPRPEPPTEEVSR